MSGAANSPTAGTADRATLWRAARRGTRSVAVGPTEPVSLFFELILACLDRALRADGKRFPEPIGHLAQRQSVGVSLEQIGISQLEDRVQAGPPPQMIGIRQFGDKPSRMAFRLMATYRCKCRIGDFGHRIACQWFEQLTRLADGEPAKQLGGRDPKIDRISPSKTRQSFQQRLPVSMPSQGTCNHPLNAVTALGEISFEQVRDGIVSSQ